MTNTHYRRINETDTCAFTTTAIMEKKHEGKSMAMAQFNKAIIGHRTWKIIQQMN